MPITLQRFANGDTNYVSKHNTNADAIEQNINSLETRVNGTLGTTLSTSEAFIALFGTQPAVIGATSWATTASGTNLVVQPGLAWQPVSGRVVRLLTSASIPFVGRAAGTYYVSASTTLAAQAVTSAQDALYTVVWTGSAFGAITRVAQIVWGAADWIAAQSSTALAATYTTLDARFEAVEALVGSAGTARTAQTTRTTVALAAANVTLTDVQANAAVIEFTGTLTANVEVTVPTTQTRTWLVVNSTTGNFRVTFKTSGGAGVILPTSASMFVYHNGSNTISALVGTSLLALPSATTLTADFARADVVRVTLTANSSITLTGARDGQKCVLEVLQNGTGGWSLSFGGEVATSTDVGSPSISSGANSRTKLGFIYNAAASEYDLVAVARGY